MTEFPRTVPPALSFSTGSGRSSRLRRVASWLAVPILIEVLSWQAVGLLGGTNLDQSWQAGLEMALHFHLAFGPQVIFTYGPLGFLAIGNAAGMTAVWYGSLAVISLLYTIVLRFALSAAIYHSARRSYGGLAGFVLALVAVTVTSAYFADLTVVLIVLVWALGTDLASREDLLLVATLALVAAVESLEKISIGGTAIVMVAIYALSANTGQRRLRQIGVTLLAYVIALLSLWLVVGEPLSALPDYARGSYEITAGYSAAMSTTQRGLGWTVAAAIIFGLLGAWLAWTTSVAFTRRRRLAVVVLWAVFWFSAFKEGFVRQDAAHVPIFMAAMVGGVFAFRLQRRVIGLGVACLALGVCSWMGVLGVGVAQVFHPGSSISALRSDVTQILDSSDRAKLLAKSTASVLTAGKLPRGSVRLLRGHTVAIYPDQIALVWAYRLDWRPLPVLQSYSAYTPWLDRLDANYLASSYGPQRIIIQAGTSDVDDRFLSFDEPYATMAIFCRYRPLLLSKDYGIFARASDRCSARHKLKTVTARWGQTVHVPAPPTARSLVLAVVTGTRPSGSESIEGALLKPTEREVTLNGYGPLRLVAAVTADGLPMTAAPGVDYRWPYTVTPLASRIAISQKRANQPSSKLTYAFYYITVHPRGSGS